MPTATVKGLPELLRELQRLSEAAQGRVARNMTMAAARAVAKSARALAPVETGQLRASIKARRGKTRLARGQAISYANARAFYSHMVEHGTVHAAARPFMRPALDANHVEIRRKMIDIGTRGLQRELKRQAVAEDLGEI